MSLHPDIAAVLAGDSEGCIITGDCLEIMADMPGRCIDSVLTDPPYGLDFRREEWDSHIPEWLSLARAISPVVVFTTAPTTLWDYPRPDWVAILHRTASCSRTAYGGFNNWTPVVVYGKWRPRCDVLYYNSAAHAQPLGFPHPSPKPHIVANWLVQNAPHGIILDPFCGSGTTCVAAKKLGRKFIGIEIDEKYAEIARNRVRSTPRPLFAEATEAKPGAGLFAEDKP